jgi:hypothetical protein
MLEDCQFDYSEESICNNVTTFLKSGWGESSNWSEIPDQSAFLKSCYTGETIHKIYVSAWSNTDANSKTTPIARLDITTTTSIISVDVVNYTAHLIKSGKNFTDGIKGLLDQLDHLKSIRRNN